MRNLSIYFICILLICATSSFAQRFKYEVKVVLDSVKNVKGTLQKVADDGISVTDFRGTNFILQSKNIVKIKVRRKGLNFIESLATGTGIGLAGGAMIILLGNESNLAVTLAVGLTGVGAVGGALGSVVAKALNTELILDVNKDPAKFKEEYLKLEKYSKSFN